MTPEQQCDEIMKHHAKMWFKVVKMMLACEKKMERFGVPFVFNKEVQETFKPKCNL